MRRLCLPLALFAVGLAGPAVRADVKPHGLFTDGMVLQRGTKCPVWGSAEAGEAVTVRLQGGQGQQTEAKGTADQDGKWKVELSGLEAGGPYTLAIEGKNKLALKDVYVGEVWVASGQSNMEQRLFDTTRGPQHANQSRNPKIRLYMVPHKVSAEPVHDVNAKWQECGPKTVGGFSAVAYYFGRDLQKALNVPIGLIESNWGGTVAEAWAPRSALADKPDLAGMLNRKFVPNNTNQPCVLYNGMIHPLQPFAIRGAIWYQGESNAGRAHQYRTLFPAMIEGWRATWKEGAFPFLFVQLAPFMTAVDDAQESAWAELREAQLLTSKKLKNTAMAVITDVGDERDIHPREKEPVGARLALAARALAYGHDVAYSGPLYDSMQVEGNKVVLNFQHVGKGLRARGGTLTGFTIAGQDHKFHNAHAVLKGDKVTVWSDEVASPVAVRYGWANYPTGNLWNKNGLPASPFRTDDWVMVTGPKPAGVNRSK